MKGNARERKASENASLLKKYSRAKVRFMTVVNFYLLLIIEIILV